MEEIERKTDRRILKTKKAIRTAFIRLLTIKDYNEITVKNVADEADVDRKTVYNYYSGIYAIREELENDIVMLIDESLKKLDFRNNLGNPQKIFETLAEIIRSNLPVYGNLLNIKTNSEVIRRMNEMLAAKVCEGLQNSPIAVQGAEKLRLISQFITAGMLAVFQSWYNNGCVQPLEKLSLDLGNVILFGLQPLGEGRAS